MKQILLLCACCFPLLLFGQAAGIQEENPFTESDLNATRLSAFSDRGLQKVEEFQALSQITADESYAPAMREQAAGMILDLFANQSTPVLVFDKEESKVVAVPLAFYLTELQAAKPQFIPMQVLIQKRTEKPDLSWEYVVSLQLEDTTELQEAYWKIFLQKVPSRFGEAEIAVWKVLLGPMQTQPF